MPGKSFSRIYLWQILSVVEHVVIEREFFLSLSLQHRKDTFGWINCQKTELPCQWKMNVFPTLIESVSFSLSHHHHLPYECGLASWVLAHHHHQGLRLKVWILQHWRVEVMVVVLLLHFTGDFFNRVFTLLPFQVARGVACRCLSDPQWCRHTESPSAFDSDQTFFGKELVSHFGDKHCFNSHDVQDVLSPQDLNSTGDFC